MAKPSRAVNPVGAAHRDRRRGLTRDDIPRQN